VPIHAYISSLAIALREKFTFQRGTHEEFYYGQRFISKQNITPGNNGVQNIGRVTALLG
jgi:hypothetical protein